MTGCGGRPSPFVLAGIESVMARSKSYPVALSSADRRLLVKLLRTGSRPAQQVRRSRILLELDQNDPSRQGPVPTQAVVAERAGVSVDLVQKVSKAYVERGGDVQATISRKKRHARLGATELPTRGSRAVPNEDGQLGMGDRIKLLESSRGTRCRCSRCILRRRRAVS